MEQPKELSAAEIRNYMLQNGCKVTNHALVKHFKRFLTHPQKQNEARKQFKTYVNILSTIKNENNQKYLILRQKYINECPSAEVIERAVAAAASTAAPSSPGGGSIISESGLNSPFRQPPPYKPPPDITASPISSNPVKESTPIRTTAIGVHQETTENYRDCVNELSAMIQPNIETDQSLNCPIDATPNITGNNKNNLKESYSIDDTSNKENISLERSDSTPLKDSDANKENEIDSEITGNDNPMSVKEATRKFNRMASEEEAKVISPPAKKKAEKNLIEEKELPEVTLAHPKAKEWIVAMAKANYHELAKLANDNPELVKLQDPATTALHWGAKHGNEDVVKLIAGTYKADVNARTNAGYTPLHLATQFGRDNIFELLWNVYKANRDLMDWSGNKPLDYSQQRPSVSASTCSKIKARKKHTLEKDLGFLRIGSLNVRVKKTTEAFSNFLGVGGGNGNVPMGMGGGTATVNRHHQQNHRHYRVPHHLHPHNGIPRNRRLNQRPMTAQYTLTSNPKTRSSVPIDSNIYELMHKSWGSADNIPQSSSELMPPPKRVDPISKRNKSVAKRGSDASNSTNSPRDSISSSNSSSTLNSGYSSMPTTPNQIRAPMGVNNMHPDCLADSDSDSACGFDSNWSVNGRCSLSSGNLKSA